MPVKKKSFLIDTSEFEKIIQSNNLQELEKILMELMNLSNTYYDTVYRKYKNNPDTEKFTLCKQNFSQIKSVIESKANITPLINKFYMEAWISTLYSDVHALNLEPETKKQLDELNKKIQTISTEFKQLLTKKSSLDINDEKSVNLLKYIDSFEHTWKTHEKRLLADSTFNFAEVLIEQADFQQALYHFESAKNLYDEATANATDNGDKMQLKKFSAQTSARLKKIKNTHLEAYFNNLGNELRIHLQRLPDSITNWKIVNESSPTELINEKQKIKSFTEKDSFSSQIKRKANEELTYPKTKKQKIDPAGAAHPKIKFQWKTECEQLLKEFNLIGMNYNSNSINTGQKSLNRIKADICFKSALIKTENLIYLPNNLANSEKQHHLEELKYYFSQSIYFYNQAALLKEKGKVIHCFNMLTTTIEKLKDSFVKIYNSRPLTKKNLNVVEIQFTSPVRYTRTFFKNLSCSEKYTTKVDDQPLEISQATLVNRTL